jgi:hypothetical protein
MPALPPATIALLPLMPRSIFYSFSALSERRPARIVATDVDSFQADQEIRKTLVHHHAQIGSVRGGLACLSAAIVD